MQTTRGFWPTRSFVPKVGDLSVGDWDTIVEVILDSKRRAGGGAQLLSATRYPLDNQRDIHYLVLIGWDVWSDQGLVLIVSFHTPTSHLRLEVIPYPFAECTALAKEQDSISPRGASDFLTALEPEIQAALVNPSKG